MNIKAYVAVIATVVIIALCLFVTINSGEHDSDDGKIFVVNNVEYVVESTSKGEVKAIGLRGETSTLVIPGTVTFNDRIYIVESIDEHAFEGCYILESVRISHTVKSVGMSAFKDCTGLKEITIPVNMNAVVTNANPVFGGCYNIEKVTLTEGTGDGYNYGDNKYAPWRISKDSFKTLVVEEGVKSIGDYTFKDCSSLCNIEFPTSLTTIKHSAFENCKAIEKLILPDGVKDLRISCFKNCEGLKELTLPVTLKTVDSNRHPEFEGCSNVEKVVMTKGSNGEGPDYKSFIGNDELHTPWYYSREAMKTLVLSEGIVSLGEGTFNGCTGLKTISFPSTIKLLGEYAFSSCTSLEAIILPDTFETVEMGAFNMCTSVKEVVMPLSIKWSGSQLGAFDGTRGVEKVTLTQGTGKYNRLQIDAEDRFWRYSSNFTTLVIAEGVKEIYKGLFKGCSKLNDVTLPKSLTKISDGSFEGCTSLKSLIIPDGVTSLGVTAFKNCTGLEELTIPISLNSVVKNDKPVFGGCNKIAKVIFTKGDGTCFSYGNNEFTPWRISKDSFRTVVFTEGITAIGDNTFKNCSKLIDIKFPQSLTDIKRSAFEGCVDLKSLTIPEDVDSLGKSSFKNCKNLEYLRMPINLDAVVSNDDPAFEGCVAVEQVFLTAGTGNGHDYEDNKNAPWVISEKFKTLIVYDGVKSIGKNMFKGCDMLTYVQFCEELESIGEDAFADINFYDVDGEMPLSISPEDLSGCKFIWNNDKLIKKSNSF